MGFTYRRLVDHREPAKLARRQVIAIGLEDELRQFIGTERYYRHFTGMLYTDGIRYLADRAGCYWLIDVVASYQSELRAFPFQGWDLTVFPNKSALVTMVED